MDERDQHNRDEDLTMLIRRFQSGDKEAGEKLYLKIYDELKKISHAYLARSDVSLQTSELVNEAFIKIKGQENMSWRDRAHFFGIAAKLMRQILVDLYRHDHAEKRGGWQRTLTLKENLLSEKQEIDLDKLDEALDELDKVDHDRAMVVEMRFFAGMSVKEISEVKGVSERTVKRDWERAKRWLYHYLLGSDSHGF